MIKKLLFIFVLGFALFLGWHWFNRQDAQNAAAPAKAAAPAMKALPVKAAKASLEKVAERIEAVGDLVAGESVVLRPEISGRISAILFQEGHKAKAGDPLIELNADEQRSALEQSLASVNLERAGFQRIREVREKNMVSQQQYDEALARLKNAEALLERDRVRLSKTKILAPFDGILGLRQVSLGDYVSPGQALVNLESVDPIKLDFKLPEKYSGMVARGQKLEVRVDAWPGRVFTGDIQAVDPRLDDATRTVKARARLANADLALKPGMFARLVLDLGAARDALFVPEQAVQAKGSTSMVFRIIDGKALLATVKTGERRPGAVEITEGLREGDWVVTDGHLKLRDGMAATVINQAAP